MASIAPTRSITNSSRSRAIAPNLQHAVVAAEDGRFLQHHGFDWIEMQKVLEDDMKRQRLGRGGSTITQQLVKNLFLTTERSLIRKAVEFTLGPSRGGAPDQKADLGAVSQRDRVGAWSIWRRSRFASITIMCTLPR